MKDIVTLQSKINRFNEEIPTHQIYLDNGKYYEMKACSNSIELGLGTCHCASHKVKDIEEITPEQYLELKGLRPKDDRPRYKAK